MGTGHMDQIFDIISALALSIAFLQVQVDRERRMPQKRRRTVAPLRQAPMQARQAGLIRTLRRQGNPTFPTALTQTISTPTFPHVPSQAHICMRDTLTR